jgi:cysteine synthase A
MDQIDVVLESAIEAIGNTPIVKLSRLTTASGLIGNILLKLDYLNPGHSKVLCD